MALAIAFPWFALRRGRELRDEIARANTDSLTGLYNRRKFTELLEQEIERARRYGRDLSLVMLDIDCLKDINDKFGHDVGDAVLKAVAEVGRGLIRWQGPNNWQRRSGLRWRRRCFPPSAI